MSHLVIDTNVLMVANEDFPPEQAGPDCVLECIKRLQSIQSGSSGERIVLDTDNRLQDEYAETLKSSRQPSTGHAFLQWLFQAGWNPAHCERVSITCTDEANQIFTEFPTNKDLADFDVSDRKFVATANAHPDKPTILQAVDAKWRGWEPALNECGLHIEWVDENTRDRLYAEHLGKP